MDQKNYENPAQHLKSWCPCQPHSFPTYQPGCGSESGKTWPLNKTDTLHASLPFSYQRRRHLLSHQGCFVLASHQKHRELADSIGRFISSNRAVWVIHPDRHWLSKPGDQVRVGFSHSWNPRKYGSQEAGFTRTDDVTGWPHSWMLDSPPKIKTNKPKKKKKKDLWMNIFSMLAQNLHLIIDGSVLKMQSVRWNTSHKHLGEKNAFNNSVVVISKKRCT